jgi:N-acetylglucosamine-6-phosphate deacetylase
MTRAQRSLLISCLLLAPLVAWALFAGLASSTRAEPAGTAPAPGLREHTPQVHAFVGARLVIGPGKVVDRGTLVTRDGAIVAAGADVAAPADARVWDVAGKTIYAGFIDAYAEQALPAPTTPAGHWNRYITPQAQVARHVAVDQALNKKLRGQGIAARLVAPAANVIKGRSALITTGDDEPSRVLLREDVALHAKLTPETRKPSEYPSSPMGALTVLRQAMHDALWYAEARSVYAAAKEPLPRPERNDALAAMQPHCTGQALVIIDAPDELYFLRANQVAQEFGLALAVRGSGFEYRRLEAIRTTGRPVILPLNFPKAPHVKTPETALAAPLDELMHWDTAPENPARLAAAGVRIALTSFGLAEPSDFLQRVRLAVRRGLSGEQALRALTVTPAELFGMGQRLGTLEPGKIASLVIADGDIFDEKGKVLETWVEGRRYVVQPAPEVEVRGTWVAAINGHGNGGNGNGASSGPKDEAGQFTLELKGDTDKLSGTVRAGDKKADLANVELIALQLTCSFDAKVLDREGMPQGGIVQRGIVQRGIVQLSATISAAGDSPAALVGSIVWPDGKQTAISGKQTIVLASVPSKEDAQPPTRDDRPPPKPKEGAKRPPAKEPPAEAPTAPPSKEEPKKPEPKKPTTRDDVPPKAKEPAKKPAEPATKAPAKSLPAMFPVNYPLGAYGRAAAPEQPKAVLFKNATVWTSGPQGILKTGCVLVEAGRIKQVAAEIEPPRGATVVDCRGGHLTPGIIDCHSHIASDGGINEPGQTITAEVRIGDFVDPDDIQIYRQLAGGVTSSNILHGSANTIGGQNQVVKFRWGALPEEMKFAQAPPGVKFALGENVKQSNWPGDHRTRYPQTRMGVEQLVRNAFQAAREYRQRWDQWNKERHGLPPRVDLELEALSEVLAGKRLIHCHAYRQDEMIALMRTCEEFKVRIATFQHVLEGYKIADLMARHGVAGSAFSDWWAYKFEVIDAIPYAGTIMHNAGIVVSFNSDDAEMGRRLNLEAAKAVKYGGVPEAEALKFVTLNPAKQLGIDRWTGSIEQGKDADLVVWSGPPLSTYSRCEQTWIDGRKYFDRQEDAKQRAITQDMRAKLVQRILSLNVEMAKPGETSQPVETRGWARHDEYCGRQHEHGHDDDHHHDD